MTANGWGPVEKDRSNGEQAAGDGLPLTLAGVVYPKGLGTHAASDIRYTMSGCTTFTAKVGLDDEVANNGSVVFQVFADGTKVYDSGVLTGASPTATVNANVTGKTALQLLVTNGGDNIDYDHADWADAKLTCGSGGRRGRPHSRAVTCPPATNTHGVAMVDSMATAKRPGGRQRRLEHASVWLGNGQPRPFGARPDFPTGLTPKMVAVGDLNGARKPDLVSANQDASTSASSLGSGAGGFRRPSRATTGLLETHTRRHSAISRRRQARRGRRVLGRERRQRPPWQWRRDPSGEGGLRRRSGPASRWSSAVRRGRLPRRGRRQP